MTSELDALAALKLDWVYALEDVWETSPVHADGLHTDARRRILSGIADATDAESRKPLGLVVQGQAGTGKTHLLSWVREQVQNAGGYIFLISPTGGSFWENVVASILNDLWRPVDGIQSQLQRFLRALCGRLEAGLDLTASVVGETALEPIHLKNLIVALHDFDRPLARECQHTLRALALYNSDDYEEQTLGEGYLLSMDEQEPGERARRGIRPTVRQPAEVVHEVSRLLALTGPTVIAVDQIDTVVAEAAAREEGETTDRRPGAYLNMLADGLLVLRERTDRTLCVLACLPATWILFREEAVTSVRDRFRAITPLDRLDDPTIAARIIENRFREDFDRVGFRPPYPTWPVTRAALDQASSYTPRGLLQRIDRHLEACLSAGVARELEAFGPPDEDEPPPPPRDLAELERLDAAFAELRANPPVITQDNEDTVVPALLAAGLAAWVLENEGAAHGFAVEPRPSAKPSLHAQLTRTLNPETGERMQWSFRAITSAHGNAALHRLTSACTASGIAQGNYRRRLFLLRQTAWSTGTKTQNALTAFEAAGGVTTAFAREDRAAFAALRTLLDEQRPGLREWLRTRRPASATALLTEALGDALGDAGLNGSAQSPKHPAGVAGPISRPDEKTGGGGSRVPASSGDTAPPGGHDSTGSGGTTRSTHHPLTLGYPVGGGEPARIDLETLRRHVAIFAGSGSGKTVLIRRLVEECALRGVSSIVLDPNNDLARLGDAWPSAPAGWRGADAELAAEYLATTDVVVWTPRRTGGRPLSFQPLPDFASVRDDPDEFEAAVDAAVTTLAGRANVSGNTAKAKEGQAILKGALRYFATGNRSSLTSFVELLADLPDGVTNLDPADRIAKALARTLEAEMVNDPLFGGHGEPVDPAVLLNPPTGRRARISVISLVGLTRDEQRQSFVNQLQMALFAWAKRNPAGERPLAGLFVMDEAQTFAPSGPTTACTASTLALASQARKYGLGLVFATQAPKGLHNGIPGNATTQFFGRLNSPTQIDVAREIARNKGGEAADIGQLGVGEFYATSEALTFEKLRTPLCLSHHPASPLTVEEVIERAR
jgi:Helicase HerA, central domain